MNSERTPAVAPFIEPYGDIILRCSDGQDYRVVKSILAIASPFFEQMFSLPQPDGPRQRLVDDLPVIPVSEDSTTLDILLRTCYPVAMPHVQGFGVIKRVLAAGLKYDITVAVQEMCRLLISERNLDSQPVRIYAIACRYELYNEARLAAIASLRIPIAETYVEDLENITAGSYFRLFQYRRKVADAVIKTLDESTDFRSARASAAALSYTCRDDLSLYSSNAAPCRRGSAAWWYSFVKTAAPVLRDVPHSQDIFSKDFVSDIHTTAQRCEKCKSTFDTQWVTAAEAVRTLCRKMANEVELDTLEN